MMWLAFASALLPKLVQGVNGGYGYGNGGYGGYGGGGYDSYTPPAPICPAFSCPSGNKAVGKADYKIWSYGCKESGMNVFNMANFDPLNPNANMNNNNKNLDKCCIERDICKQTCGMTSKACHDGFQKCTNKICKGDQNCKLNALLSDMGDDDDKDEPYDPVKTKCKGYNKGQNSSCTCVPKSDVKDANEKKLKAFYKSFNPEKLNKKGEIKEVDEVWKKWKGKEPDMFMALALKYKDKAVERRAKPPPKPYTPPTPSPKKKDVGAEEDDSAAPEAETPPAPEAADAAPEASPEKVSVVDDEWRAFESKRVELEDKKKKAAEDEEYDLADQAKEEAVQLAKKEVERLNGRKKAAIEAEEYLEAKAMKLRVQELKTDFKLEL